MSVSNRRLAAIMFTDLVGYSALTQRDEPLALELVEIKRTLLAPLLAQHKGTLIKSLGDGLLIEFPSALQAVQCAMAIQGMLKGYNGSQPDDHQINVRIGIHLGDVEFQDGDVMGDGVNIASRIEHLAEPGGICISETVHDLVDGKLKARFDSLGKPVLKNIQKEIEVFRVSPEEIEAKPIPQTSKLDHVLKVGSVIAVAVIAIVAAWFMYQSMFTSANSEPDNGTLPSTGLSSDSRTSIAFLRFSDVSPNQDQRYLSEGIPFQLSHSLAGVEDLKVISTQSSFSPILDGMPIDEIANRLGVENLLQGTVIESDNRLKVTAQLIRASDQSVLWSEQFDREREDLFQIMEEIASDTLIKFGYSIGPNEQIVKIGTTNIQAYKAYLEGRAQWNKRSKEGFAKAKEYFEQALELDPNYVESYVGLANVYQNSVGYGYLSREEGYPRAEELALTAIELDGNSAEAYATLGQIYRTQYQNWEQAETYFRRSFEINPNYSTAHHWYSILLANTRGNEEALIHAELAHELEPLSPAIWVSLSWQLRLMRRFDEAIKAAEKSLEIDPEFVGGFRGIAGAYQSEGNWDQAEEVLRRAIQQFPDSGELHYHLGLIHLYQGQFEDADLELVRAVELIPDNVNIQFEQGFLLIASHEYDKAIAHFEKMTEAYESSLSAWRGLAWALYFRSDTQRGLNTLDHILDVVDSSHPDRGPYLTLKAMFYAKQGNMSEIEQLLDLAQQEKLYTDHNSPTYFAYLHAALGNEEEMFRWLDIVIEDLTWEVDYVGIHPIFDPYRFEPRFQELLAKMGLAD